MKELQIITTLAVYSNCEELPEEAKVLMQKAVEAREKAYAPYSRFKVGAALQLSNGAVVSGNNQENAAFPSGLCAERVAIYSAGANYPEAMVTVMAITATAFDKVVSTPVPPCGACRQAIAEYENKQHQNIVIYFMGETGAVYKANSLKDILPLVFDGSLM